ncbi:MAG: hypothetical protein OXF30_03010 [Candidatus Saccharibacteria bacterium]|nr:hypothetical protein [Candidatus Saccharibacteria bacterium]
MGKKLIIILAPIIVLLAGMGLMYVFPNHNVKYGDVNAFECPRNIDTDTEKYYCNSDGKVSKTKYYDAEGNLIEESEAEYDSDGNLMQAELYDADGDLREYYKYEYNADVITDKFIKQEDYSADGILRGYWQFEYDADGNTIKKEGYGAYGNFRGYYKYEYDADGNTIKEERYGSDGKLIDTRYFEP